MKNLEIIKSRILEIENLKRQLAIWRFQNKKIIFTNGCFDILHPGHIDYLSRAKDLGDVLIIGMNTDASVSRIKGESRPIVNQESRAMILASLRFVDAIVMFEDDTPYQLIQLVKPDILVKGSDYKPSEIIGSDVVEEKGGKIVTIPFLEGYSTSSVIEKIRSKL